MSIYVYAGATYPCRAIRLHVVTPGTCECRRSAAFILAGPVYHNALKNCAALLCRTQRRVARMCSSTLSVNCEIFYEINAESNPTAVPHFAAVPHVGNLAETKKSRETGVKRVETVGVYPLAPRRGYGESPHSEERTPAEVQQKTPARQGRTRLRQFVCLGQPGVEKEPPGRGEHANAVRMPRKLGAEKGARLAASPKERG